MSNGQWIAFVSLLFTMISGFGVTLIKIGELVQRVDLLWAWYIETVAPRSSGGRRRTDPPVFATADDDPHSS